MRPFRLTSCGFSNPSNRHYSKSCRSRCQRLRSEKLEVRKSTFFIAILSLLAGCGPTREMPVIVGEPWKIAGDPDLGEFTSPKQQPVDFGVWQANDGTWQLWSCIRGTKCGGNTRLFYSWE